MGLLWCCAHFQGQKLYLTCSILPIHFVIHEIDVQSVRYVHVPKAWLASHRVFILFWGYMWRVSIALATVFSQSNVYIRMGEATLTPCSLHLWMRQSLLLHDTLRPSVSQWGDQFGLRQTQLILFPARAKCSIPSSDWWLKPWIIRNVMFSSSGESVTSVVFLLPESKFPFIQPPCHCLLQRAVAHDGVAIYHWLPASPTPNAAFCPTGGAWAIL